MSKYPSIAWKVLTAPQLSELLEQGVFAGAPIDIADGYIHLSTIDQLAETVDKHFNGQYDLHLTKIDLARLGVAIRWEPARGGALFPHIYAPLPLSAVLAHGPLVRLDEGGFDLSGEGYASRLRSVLTTPMQMRNWPT